MKATGTPESILCFEALKQLLERRALTPALLLRRACVPRSHGYQVLRGTRDSAVARDKIARELTREELQVLRWTPRPAREELVVEASGNCEFVARLEYTPGPDARALIDTFQNAVLDLHRVNHTSKSEMIRRDVA